MIELYKEALTASFFIRTKKTITTRAISILKKIKKKIQLLRFNFNCLSSQVIAVHLNKKLLRYENFKNRTFGDCC